MPADLEELRRRLDEIDDKLQDLLIDRFRIVLQVGEQKRGGRVAPHQPSREAQILRRLVERNRDPLQAETMVRMWREMLAGTTRLQGLFRIAVYAPSEAQGIWDLARDHYGSYSAMLPYPSAVAIITAVAEGRAEIGVLPIPQEDETDPWWRHLISRGDLTPRVVGRLPFAGRGNARVGVDGAMSIARFAPQPSGNDRTLFICETAPDISRGRIISLLSSLGLVCTSLSILAQRDGIYALVELEGFVPLADPRIDGFRSQLGPELFGLIDLGAYAVPLPLEAPATREPVAARG